MVISPHFLAEVDVTDRGGEEQNGCGNENDVQHERILLKHEACFNYAAGLILIRALGAEGVAGRKVGCAHPGKIAAREETLGLIRGSQSD